MRLLSQNFSVISKYSCQQFLELFSELLDLYCQQKDALASEGPQVIDPEALLSSVIDQISAENQRASRARAEGQMGEAGADAARTGSSGLFLGLITLAGKILDNFGGRESAVNEQQELKSLEQ